MPLFYRVGKQRYRNWVLLNNTVSEMSRHRIWIFQFPNVNDNMLILVMETLLGSSWLHNPSYRRRLADLCFVTGQWEKYTNSYTNVANQFCGKVEITLVPISSKTYEEKNYFLYFHFADRKRHHQSYWRASISGLLFLKTNQMKSDKTRICKGLWIFPVLVQEGNKEKQDILSFSSTCEIWSLAKACT